MDEQVLIKLIAGMLDAQEARINEKFGTMDKRFEAIDKQFDEIKTHIVDVVQAVGEQMDQLKIDIKADVIQAARVLAENIEGDKLRALAEESGVHRETLADHEERIMSLEGFASVS